MAPPGEVGKGVRLFIAFDLPAELVAGIEAWQAKALDPSLWRAIAPETLHLTVVFLGSRPGGEIGAITQILEGALPARAPRIELAADPVGIPRRRPRALGLEVNGPEVVRFATKVATELARAELHEPEGRPFWPHLTVARVKKQENRRRRPAASATPVPASLLGPWSLDRLVLYRSETRPEGARHETEAELRLRS